MGCSGVGRECQRNTTGRMERGAEEDTEMWGNSLQLIRKSAKCIPVYLFCSFPAHKNHSRDGRKVAGKTPRAPLSSVRWTSEEAKASEVKRLQSPHIKHGSHISFSHTEISPLRTLNFTWHLPLCTHTHTPSQSAIKRAVSASWCRQQRAFSWARTRRLDTTEHTAVSQNLDSD